MIHRVLSHKMGSYCTWPVANNTTQKRYWDTPTISTIIWAWDSYDLGPFFMPGEGDKNRPIQTSFGYTKWSSIWSAIQKATARSHSKIKGESGFGKHIISTNSVCHGMIPELFCSNWHISYMKVYWNKESRRYRSDLQIIVTRKLRRIIIVFFRVLIFCVVSAPFLVPATVTVNTHKINDIWKEDK